MAALGQDRPFDGSESDRRNGLKPANNSRSRCRRRTLRGYSKRPLDMYRWLAGTAPTRTSELRANPPFESYIPDVGLQPEGRVSHHYCGHFARRQRVAYSGNPALPSASTKRAITSGVPNKFRRYFLHVMPGACVMKSATADRASS